VQSINSVMCLGVGKEVKKAFHFIGKNFCIKCINSCTYVNDVGYEKCYFIECTNKIEVILFLFTYHSYP